MRHHHSPGIRGQLMWFLCCICLFLLALVWFLSTQLLEPQYTKNIEKQLTTQAESITAELDKAIANGEALSAWSFGHLTVNTAFFDRLATQLYASGSLNSFCVDISDTTMRTIYKIENQSYCNLHETLLSDSANNDMIVSTAVAMRKKCRTTGGFVQTLNPPRLSGSAQLLVGRNTSGGEYTVLVTTSLVHVAEAGRVLSTVLPMAAALIFAFAMTAAWLFSEWFTKPLRQLSSAARQMAMGNYAVQVDTRRSDELGDLARDFNHMASEVQHSSQMQRDLLANVSHDLRTPLTSISGNASNLLSNGDMFDAKTKHQMYVDIYDDAMWLINLVENILSISRIEDGRMNLSISTELVSEVFEEALRHTNRHSEQHTITVQMDDDLLLAHMDAKLVVQGLINLVDNAIKYTPAGSHIVLSAAAQGESAVIRVSDDGPGIPDEAKEKVFEMFSTGEKRISDSRRSLGLGLALCRTIIAAHGGTITLSDNTPHGCIFTFTLPLGEVSLHE